MKKALTEEQFEKAISHLNIHEQTASIAYGILVKGQAPSHYIESLGITKGAVSQAVNKVWKMHYEKNHPAGYRKVTAFLPAYKAALVDQWANAELKKIGKKS